MFLYQAQGSYYGEQEARLGHFPSSVVEETHALMPAEVEVKTNVSICALSRTCSMFVTNKKILLTLIYNLLFVWFFLAEMGLFLPLRC